MRALVIDDSRATRAILRRILQQLDGEVVDANDGQHGLDVLAAEQANGGIDVVLVDWNMPVMDGLEFVRCVRADSSYDGLPIVMVTTEGDAEHLITAMEAGANEYAMKPFTASVIREKLELLGITG